MVSSMATLRVQRGAYDAVRAIAAAVSSVRVASRRLMRMV